MISEGYNPIFSQTEKPENQSHAFRVEVDLFAPPKALGRMNQLLSAEPVDLRRLGEAVREDPDNAAEALRLCNSSLFGLFPPAMSVEQAVVTLDAEIVRSLLLTCWLTRYSAAHILTCENRKFWRHSLLVAQLGRRMAEWLNYTPPEKAFLAGLLHDAGNLPFLSFFSRNGLSSHKGIYEDVGDSVELQQRRFGTDHCELGMKMNSILGLPGFVGEAVECHHQRVTAWSGMIPIIRAAEMISHTEGGAANSNDPAPSKGRAIRTALEECFPGLSGPTIGGLVDVLDAELQTAAPPGSALGRVWDDSALSSATPSETGDHPRA